MDVSSNHIKHIKKVGNAFRANTVHKVSGRDPDSGAGTI